MKKFIYLLLIVVTVVACKKEETPTPIAPPVTTTPTTNPPASTQKFYVGVLANYNDDNNGAHETYEVVPTVIIEGDTLTYVNYVLSPNIQSGVVDVVFEYNITNNINCNDVIDFTVSFNTDSLNPSDKIQEIQIYHVPYFNMVPEWVGPSSWYNVTWSTPNPLEFNYTNINVICN